MTALAWSWAHGRLRTYTGRPDAPEDNAEGADGSGLCRRRNLALVGVINAWTCADWKRSMHLRYLCGRQYQAAWRVLWCRMDSLTWRRCSIEPLRSSPETHE